MRVLHVITQKPNSTGSGVYMCGLINGFKELGHKQAVIAGISSNDDDNIFDKDIAFYPIKYNTSEIPFEVLGMSDVMPYKSTRYRDLTSEMVSIVKANYKNIIEKAVKEFKPDIIICNHLYLITALVRETVKDIPVYSVCHGTCLRQFKSHGLEREYIASNIRQLDGVFALHDEQAIDIVNTLGINEKKVHVLGSGYSDEIFFKGEELKNDCINITYAGKICKTKGIESFIKSLDKLDYKKELIKVNVVGDSGDRQEYEQILSISNKLDFDVNFTGKVKQNKLADIFRKTHIFVLPSFYEGLPLVVVEALACGSNVVTTDLPGLKKYLGKEINDSKKVEYVELPPMKSIDKPCENHLPMFEEKLKNAINESVESIIKNNTRNKFIDMEHKSWKGLAVRMNKAIVNC